MRTARLPEQGRARSFLALLHDFNQCSEFRFVDLTNSWLWLGRSSKSRLFCHYVVIAEVNSKTSQFGSVQKANFVRSLLCIE